MALDRPISEGSELTLICSSDGSSGNSVLRILRRRGGGGGIDGFEDLANFATRAVQVSADRPDIAVTFFVSRKDDRAEFICGNVETLGFQSQTPAASRIIRVQFDPRSLSLKSIPGGGMREDMSKLIICRTDEGGSNPAVNITWRHLSPLGGVESLEEDMHATTSHRMLGDDSGDGFVTQSNLTVLAHRRLNGHRIECSVEKPGRIALQRQSETLEIIFAPNSVQIHPSATGGIFEGEAISLTCSVAVSHPPATVRWFELPPGFGGAAESGREITDLAQIDLTPGEYGGMLLDSTLRISKTFRSNSQTEYRCIVNQAALNNPVVAEYKLHVLYPPNVEIVSLPNNPSEGQSVTLSCLTHGGMPDKGFSFSWWHTKDLQLSSIANQNGLPTTSQELNPVQAKSLIASLNTTHLFELFSTYMTQIPSQTGRHLMLDAITVEQCGWYGCQVASSGGTTQSLHFLLINYAPRINRSMKFVQYAQSGMKCELVLMVDAHPARAEFMWFWIGDDSLLANKARNIILHQSSLPATIKHRRSLAPLKAISTSVAPWINRVKQTSAVTEGNRLKFTLTFREVIESDFGIYMCQVNHIAGNREFYFELKPQSDAKGINPDSIRIASEGRKVRVEFEPPNNQFYSHINLRICLNSWATSTSMGASERGVEPSGELVFLRSIKDPTKGSSVPPSSTDMLGASNTGDYNECSDYEVTFAELGFLQVELDRSAAEYTFQFLVYQDTQLRQITQPTRWTSENQSQTPASSKLFMQLIIGIVIALLVVCLIAFFIYYFRICIKRENMKKLAPTTGNGLLHGARTYQTWDSKTPFGAGSITADKASSCQSAKGFYSPQPTGHITNSAHPLLENTYHALHNAKMRGSPSNVSHVSALTQRILSEVYIAAAKAASIAVSESIASDSMDAVNQNVGGPRTYRSGSNHAESVSMIGESISALDGLTGYPVTTPDSVSRMPSARTATSIYQGHPTPQHLPLTLQLMGQQILRPHIPSLPGARCGWNSPMLTVQATKRLNDAANALAAAAAAAVLEATEATPDLGIQSSGSHVSRLSGGGGSGGLATSSEDGESISSSSYFHRNPNGKSPGQEAGAKSQRRKPGANARNGSLSTTRNESLLPMLAIPSNVAPSYPHIVHPHDTLTSSSELAAYMPCMSTESTWAQNFQPIGNPKTGDEATFTSYSHLRNGTTSSISTVDAVSTFTNSPTPTASRRPPNINPQCSLSSTGCTTDDGNPNDNTIRANVGTQELRIPSQSE